MPDRKTNPTLFSGEASGHTSILHRNLPGAVIALDGHGKITAFCAEAERLTGLQAAAVIGQTAEKLPVALHAIVKEIFASAKPGQHQQISLTGMAGTPREMRVHAVVTAAAGKVEALVLVLNDLAATRLLEAKLRRLDRLANIGTLSASMAHEVKNAIVAVRTFVDLLLEKQRESELAEIVGREMKRIDAIVSQMLRVSGPAKPDVAAVRGHEALNHSLRLVQHQLNERLITLRKSFAAPTDAVAGDLYQLEQAFMNLLLNAVEAMGAGGELTVTTGIVAATDSCPAQFQIAIRDTGVGIAPENIGRLFETFFTTKKNGTGLGLSITRRIIEEHRGKISVASELNAGTTFTVLLPLVAEQA